MKNPHSLIFLLFLTMLGALPPLSIDMALPGLRQMSLGLATPPGTIGLTLTLFMIGISTTPLIYGPLSDRYGRRPMLLTGIALFTLGSCGATFAPDIGLLLAARLVEGAGAGAGMTMAFAIIRDLFTGDESRVKLSYMQMIVGVAPLIAPSLGAAILIIAGWRAIYGVLLLSGALLLATVLLLPESHARPDRTEPIFGQVAAAYRTLFTSRLGFGYALVFAVSFGTQFSYIAGSPLVFMGQFRLSALQYGLSFACNAAGMMVGAYLNALLARRHVAAALPLSASLGVALAAILAMLGLAATGHAGPVGFTALQMVCALCFGLSGPIAAHATLEALPRIAGTAGAVLTAMRMGTAVVASAVVAASYASFGLYAMLVPMLVFTLLTIAIYVLVVQPGRVLAPIT